MKTKKLLSTLLAISVSVSTLAAATITANADVETPGKKTINMGGSIIAKNDNIYYGNQTKWRVLSTNGNETKGDGAPNYEDDLSKPIAGPLFVLSENDFGTRAFNSYAGQNWQGSAAQAWCNGTADGQFYKTAGITDTEKAAILTTIKSDAEYGSFKECSIDDKVFYLSANEADTYLKYNNDREFAPGGEAAVHWWLRSPEAESAVHVGIGDDDCHYPYDGSVASRPAFNLNSSEVLFTSAASGGKTVGTPTDYSGNEWKLTLLDTKRAFTISNVTRNGNTLTVEYSGAKTGTNEKISYIITDKNEIKYYGNQAATDASGSFEITLPESRTARLFVFNEQVNEDYKTDYSSELQEVEINKTIKLNVSVNDSAMGSVTVSPEKPISGETVTLTATANSGYEFVGFESNDVTIATDGTTGTFVAPEKDVTVKANFGIIKLTVSVNDNTMGSVTASPQYPTAGESVTLTATANEGYKFVGFESNDVTIATNGTTGTFTMPAKDVTVTAVFEEYFPVKVEYDNTKGLVAVNPAKPKQGESVTLTATANEGYRFVGFESDDVEKLWISGNECMFTMPFKDVTVTANFEAVSGAEHTVTVVSNYPQMGSASANVTTAKTGDVVTLSNSPASGNSFVEYISGDVNIEGNTFRMLDKDVTVIAIFKANASFADNTSTPIQAQKDNGTAILRFMWGLNKTDGAYMANVGAYIIPWDLFDNKEAANPAVVLVTNPTMKSGDTFSADYINIPEASFETKFCAIPFINGTFFTDALLYGNVNTYDVNKAE